MAIYRPSRVSAQLRQQAETYCSQSVKVDAEEDEEGAVEAADGGGRIQERSGGGGGSSGSGAVGGRIVLPKLFDWYSGAHAPQTQTICTAIRIGYIWLYIWLYMAIHGYIWLYMAIRHADH